MGIFLAALPRAGRAADLPRRIASAHAAGVPAATAAMHATITLPLRDAAGLNQLLMAQQDPSGPLFRRWLTPEAFAERFGATAADYAAVADWLAQGGLQVRRWPNRLRLDVWGEVRAIERQLGVQMRNFVLPERTVMASTDTPQIPTALSALVEHVRLDNAPLAKTGLRVNTSAGLVSVLGPGDLHVAYNLAPLLSAGIDGSGVKIAIVARSDFKLADVGTFRQQAGLPVMTPVKFFPSMNPGIGSIRGVCSQLHNPQAQATCIEGEEGEVLLDAEWAGGAAPGAEILVDIAGTDIDASLADIVTNHADAKVISMSFGLCERLDAGDSQPLFFPLYRQAAAQGQTIFVSAGDDGSDGCQDGGSPAVSILASDANVTSVGGTTLDPGFDTQGNATAYVSERVWNDDSGAGGGGVSTVVARPSYQNGAGIADGATRLQPDVCLAGSAKAPGFLLIFEGFTTVAGGTSIGAPIWAGTAALLGQYAGADGLGALNASLYRIARKQYVYGAPAVFRDVIVGQNGFNGVAGYSAGPGYDQASGLGSPDASALAHALAECPGDCNSDGAVTVDEILLGVNITLETEPYPRCAAADVDGDGQITVNELISAVDRALGGCRG